MELLHCPLTVICILRDEVSEAEKDFTAEVLDFWGGGGGKHDKVRESVLNRKAWKQSGLRRV